MSESLVAGAGRGRPVQHFGSSEQHTSPKARTPGNHPRSQGPTSPTSKKSITASHPMAESLRKRRGSKHDHLYKTEQCRSWAETGMCSYGNRCQFAHGDDVRPVVLEKNYKTEQCKNILKDGVCPYGVRCRFIHDDDILVEVDPTVECPPAAPRPIPGIGADSCILPRQAGTGQCHGALPESDVPIIPLVEYHTPQSLSGLSMDKRTRKMSFTNRPGDPGNLQEVEEEEIFTIKYYRWMPNPNPSPSDPATIAAKVAAARSKYAELRLKEEQEGEPTQEEYHLVPKKMRSPRKSPRPIVARQPASGARISVGPMGTTPMVMSSQPIVPSSHRGSMLNAESPPFAPDMKNTRNRSASLDWRADAAATQPRPYKSFTEGVTKLPSYAAALVSHPSGDLPAPRKVSAGPPPGIPSPAAHPANVGISPDMFDIASRQNSKIQALERTVMDKSTRIDELELRLYKMEALLHAQQTHQPSAFKTHITSGSTPTSKHDVVFTSTQEKAQAQAAEEFRHIRAQNREEMLGSEKFVSLYAPSLATHTEQDR